MEAYDVIVHDFGFHDECADVHIGLQSAGFQTGYAPLCDTQDPVKRARVHVVFITSRSICLSTGPVNRTLKAMLSSGETVIPIFCNKTVDFLGWLDSVVAMLDKQVARSDSVFAMLDDFRWYKSRRVERHEWRDIGRQLKTVTGHHLARYNDDGDKLKLEILIHVSRVVHVPLLEETKQLRSLNQIFNMQVSSLQEDLQHARNMIVSSLKLLCGEFLKHVLLPTPSYRSQSSKFQKKVGTSKIQKFANLLSMKPQVFARKADRCLDARNEVAHFVADKDWRKHFCEAARFISRYPGLKDDIPDQVPIISAHRKIGRGFGLPMIFTGTKC